MPFLPGRKPEWLYEALPVFYIVAGGATLAFGRASPLALISGALLALAGTSATLMRLVRRRRRYREALAECDSLLTAFRMHPDEDPVPGAPPPIGHAEIDQQHRTLDAKARQMRKAFRDGAPESDIDLAALELIDALGMHFEAEAALMARLGLPDGPLRKARHDALLHRAELAMGQFRHGAESLAWLVNELGASLVGAHLHEPHLQLQPSAPAADARRQPGPGVESTLP